MAMHIPANKRLKTDADGTHASPELIVIYNLISIISFSRTRKAYLVECECGCVRCLKWVITRLFDYLRIIMAEHRWPDIDDHSFPYLNHRRTLISNNIPENL